MQVIRPKNQNYPDPTHHVLTRPVMRVSSDDSVESVTALASHAHDVAHPSSPAHCGP